MNYKKLLPITLIILSIQILFATGMEELLSSGDVINSSIEQKEKHYYKIKVPKNKSLDVELLNLTADIDLYVKAQKVPTLRVNDCYSSNSNLENETCTLNNSDEESYYYILVYGYEKGDYRLNVSVGELKKIDILTEEEVKGDIAKGVTKDYKFSAKKGEKVTVKLYGLSADADLRLKVGRKANRHTFDCKSINGGTKDDICSLTLKEEAWVYVQVDGYKSANYSLKLEKNDNSGCISREELIVKLKDGEDVTEVNTSCITDMHDLFFNTFGFNFNQDISNWDVSNVTDMSWMFVEQDNFNQDISSWDVSKVTNMKGIFYKARAFNQDIGKWDVSNVTNMYGVFSDAQKFNQDISSWNVSNVTNMGRMFTSTKSFNQDISSWDVSKVTNMKAMFGYRTKFNQDISSWNVSNVTNMSWMFVRTKNFNQDISSWDVANVTNMRMMFGYGTKFNQDISSWNVSNVTNMRNMFFLAESFSNHDLSSWNVKKVTDHKDFLSGSGSGNTEPKWTN